MFNPCIIIPHYNHGHSIGEVLEQLQYLQLPIIVVDDGSDDEHREHLRTASIQFPIEIISLDKNQGKGGAVKRGLLHAHEHGFSHAMQIDADGQHDLSKAATLLHFSQTYPDAVISAQPVFSNNAPPLRVYARFLSHIWVWLETLSFDISDTMCGFRVYPLSATHHIISKHRLGNRMSFDTEILVRLHWHGTQVIMCPVDVNYPEDGVSHFRFFHDNVHHIWMHICLICTMVLNIPRIISNKFKRKRTSPAHWSELNERGNSIGLQTLILLYRIFGLHFIYALMLPVTLYFVIFNHHARRASQDFQRKVNGKRIQYGLKPIPLSPFTTFRHFYNFSVATFEKVQAWMVESVDYPIEFPNRPEMLKLKESPRGGLIICSHLGYNDLIRAIAHRSNRAKVNILVYHRHAMKYNALIKKINPESNVNVIHVNTIKPEIAILLKSKVDQGEIVFVAGDRTSPERHGRDVSIPFLGMPASFPNGPAILGHILECPIYFFFCLKSKDTYYIHFEKYAERLNLHRSRRNHDIEQLMTTFAQRLELLTIHHPFQWFNFYDFWETTND